MTRALLMQVVGGACALAVCASLVACAPAADAPEATTPPATTAAVTAPATPAFDLQPHDADFERGLVGSNETRDVAYVAARNDWSYVAVALRRSDGQKVCLAGPATAEEDGATTRVSVTDELTGTPIQLALTPHEPEEENSAEPAYMVLAVDSYPDFTLNDDSGHAVAVQIHQMARI